ncbi:MAG: hypothetical protein JJE53_01860 [Candidatus Pacebacteria bacterium]|nr:hypothetical protein [Candidatus Paceibacterota bacterium]
MNFDQPQNNTENLLKNSLESIENSNLENENKLELALLMLDKKQGVQLGDFKIINSENEKEIIIKEFSEKLLNIIKTLEAIGLKHEIVKELSEDNGIIGFSVLVSKETNTLDKFVKADKEDDDKTFGLIVGYPASAVDAYGTDKALNIEQELPKAELEKLHSEGVLPFLLFMPSKEHWNEELDWARENQRLIKEKTPKLYKELNQTRE